MNNTSSYAGQIINISPTPFNSYTYYLKDVLATNRVIPLLWGNGYQLNTKKDIIEKFFKKLFKDNRIYKTFEQVEKILSMWGQAVVTLNRTKTGDIKLVIGDPAFINQVGSVFDEEVGAIVYKRFTHTTTSYQIREEWTDKYVRRTGINQENKEVALSELLVQVPEHLRIPEYEEHNLGFVPVVRFSNRSNFTVWGVDQNWLWHPDDYACWRIQEQLEKTFNQLEKERTNNTTRLFGAFTPLDMYDRDWIGHKNPLLSDMIIQNKDNTATGLKGAGSQFEILAADPKFAQYIELIKFYQDQYFMACGYSPMNQQEQVGTQASATEIVAFKELDVQTTRNKKSLRTEDWNRLFRKALAMANIGFSWEELQGEDIKDNNTFFFEIKDALKISLPNASEIDVFSKELALGVSSPVEYLMKTRAMSEDEATNHLDSMKKHNKKYDTFGELNEEGENGASEEKEAKEE